MPEPIGGSAPKFASDSESTKITRDVKQTLTLTCSAQGSPVPTFRLVNLGQPVFFSHSEPIGGSLPKFSVNTDGLRVSNKKDTIMTLTCPAQGFPTPTFRLVAWLRVKSEKFVCC